jgi:DNA-binding response OmpR family regulator
VRPSILVVEDDTALRHLYRAALSLAGFHVREAGDGYDALKALDVEPPDLVVLDMMLPTVSGHVVRAELAAQAHTRDIPIVIVTGSTGIDIRRIESEGECVLRKPVAPDRLVEVIREHLASGPSDVPI